MPVVNDDFVSSSIDSDMWNVTSVGNASYVSGNPSPGLFVSGVENEGDAFFMDSKGKVGIPAGLDFDVKISYGPISPLVEASLAVYLGWRSLRETSPGEVPLNGVDVIALLKANGNLFFQQRLFTHGEVVRGYLLQDNTATSSQLRLKRVKDVYSLYYESSPGIWDLLHTFAFTHAESGYIEFAQMAEDPTFEFAWIIAPS